VREEFGVTKPIELTAATAVRCRCTDASHAHAGNPCEKFIVNKGDKCADCLVVTHFTEDGQTPRIAGGGSTDTRICNPRVVSVRVTGSQAYRSPSALLARFFLKLIRIYLSDGTRPDLVRALLLYFEAKQEFRPIKSKEIAIAGYDSRAIVYHIDLMYEGGFLSCEPVTSSTSNRLIEAIPFRLTWKGHEFLDAMRNEGIWKQVKATLRSKAIGVTFDMLKDLLMSQATKHLP
jgi:hypothetical protein